jgi:predicted nucleotidyltransferase
MTLPNRSIRIDPTHSDVLATLLGLLRRGQAESVRAALRGVAAGEAPVGPFRGAAAALDFLIGRMVAVAHPQAIWLFGSRARGDARPDSDFDFLAVFPDDDPVGLDERRHQLADAVMGAGVGVDVTCCSAAEFVTCKDMAGALIRTVHEQGRQVYAARRPARP